MAVPKSAVASWPRPADRAHRVATPTMAAVPPFFWMSPTAPPIISVKMMIEAWSESASAPST